MNWTTRPFFPEQKILIAQLQPAGACERCLRNTSPHNRLVCPHPDCQKGFCLSCGGGRFAQDPTTGCPHCRRVLLKPPMRLFNPPLP